MSDNVYVYIQGNSAKVWGYDVFSPTEEAEITDVRVIYYWGPIGKAIGQLTQKETIYQATWQARDAIQKKVDEKLAKGYRRVTNHRYSQLTEDYRFLMMESAFSY